jgi:predicted nucleic acid-binding protein
MPQHGASLVSTDIENGTTSELLRVLTYPKFRLSSEPIGALIADLLPWSEIWLEELSDDQPRCRDPQDQNFLDLAIGAGVQSLVSGDEDPGA